MNVTSIQGRSLEEITRKVTEVIDSGAKPTLAIVFLSIRQNIDETLKSLKSLGLEVWGGTTSGEFITGEVADGTTTVMLLDPPEGSYQTILKDITVDDYHEAAHAAAKEGFERFKNPSFILTTAGAGSYGNQIVDGFKKEVRADTVLVGGLAGDDFTKTGPRVFTNEGISRSGFAALVFDQDRVQVQALATSGWTPIGTVHTVTKSEGNVIHTIDDQPALEILVKFMGVKEDLDKWADVVINIGAEYPLHILQENDAHVIRAPLFANKEDKSFVCAGDVPVGSKIRFSLPPAYDVVENVIEESTAKNTNGTEADALVMFSCQLRNLSLGPLISDEIEGVRKSWGGPPLIGFFCYGEIGTAVNGTHEFHNNTCSFATLKEV